MPRGRPRPVERPNPKHVTLATFAEQPGGVWRHMLDLADGLTERRVGVSLAVPSTADSLQRSARNRGLTVRELSDTSADVWHVHLHDTLDRGAMLELLRRKRLSQATVATEHLPRNHATDPSLMPGGRTVGAHAAKTLLKSAALAITDRTILVSAASRRFVKDRYRVSDRRLHVIPNAIRPLGVRNRQPSVDGRISVIAVGSLIMQKGMDVLIDAAVGAESWSAEILGTGPHRQRLEDHARAVGAPVRFSGWSDDVLGRIATADIFCLPSRWEACPYVVLEAMAIGRPVIATAVDGVPEQIRDGVTGRLVSSGDPAALRSAIDALAADRALREQWGAAGAGHVADHHRFDDMVDATVAVYREAAGESS